MATYRTKQGDTFDSIAHRELGSVSHTPALMRKNSAYIDYLSFPAGIVLELPAVENPGKRVSAPWKQVAG